jgi:hypothetical protein
VGLYKREPEPWQKDPNKRDELNSAGFVLDGILSKAREDLDSIKQFVVASKPEDEARAVQERSDEITQYADSFTESEALETPPFVEDAKPAVVSVTDHEQELKIVREQAFAEGQSLGQLEGRQSMKMEAEEMSAELSIKLRDEFSEFLAAVEDNLVTEQNLFDPLKKLALVLAEQIARAELAHNDESIRRFIERSIAEIEPAQLKSLSLNVSPEWHERLQSEPLKSVVKNYDVRVDEKLSIGSIRLTVNNTSIEDLIERRVQGLAEQLFTTSPISDDQQLLFPEEGDEGFVIPGDFDEVEVDDIFFNAPEE